MNCKQCGAPLVLYRERDYYHCEHCGNYHFPSSTENGMRILGENPEGINCPLCRNPLNLVTLDNYYRGYTCSNCQGLLFKRTTFRETIETRRAKAKTPPEPVSRFSPSELERKIDCPVCTKRMGTYQYLGPGNIVIDTCHGCDLIWLDYGELTKVVNAPGRDRGVPRKKPPEIEKEDAKERNKKTKRSPLEKTLIDLLKAFFS